jgi:hypothetical protein
MGAVGVDMGRRFKRAAMIMLIPGALFGAFLGICVVDIERDGLTLDTVLTVAGWTVGGAAAAWLLMRLVGFRVSQMSW